jgi:hypothetical protein
MHSIVQNALKIGVLIIVAILVDNRIAGYIVTVIPETS